MPPPPLFRPKCFISPQKPQTHWWSLPIPPPVPGSHLSGQYFLSVWICLLQTVYIDGILYYMLVHSWLLSFTIMFWRFIRVVAWIFSFFSGLGNIPSCRQIIFCLSVHLSDIWILPPLRLFRIMLLGIFVCECLCMYAFISLGEIPRRSAGFSTGF